MGKNWLEQTNERMDSALGPVTGSLSPVTEKLAERYQSINNNSIESNNQARSWVPLLGGGLIAAIGYVLIEPVQWGTKKIFSFGRSIVTGFGLFEKIPFAGRLFTALGDGIDKVGNYAGLVMPLIGGVLGYKMLEAKKLEAPEPDNHVAAIFSSPPGVGIRPKAEAERLRGEEKEVREKTGSEKRPAGKEEKPGGETEAKEIKSAEAGEKLAAREAPRTGGNTQAVTEPASIASSEPAPSAEPASRVPLSTRMGNLLDTTVIPAKGPNLMPAAKAIAANPAAGGIFNGVLLWHNASQLPAHLADPNSSLYRKTVDAGFTVAPATGLAANLGEMTRLSQWGGKIGAFGKALPSVAGKVGTGACIIAVPLNGYDAYMAYENGDYQDVVINGGRGVGNSLMAMPNPYAKATGAGIIITVEAGNGMKHYIYHNADEQAAIGNTYAEINCAHIAQHFPSITQAMIENDKANFYKPLHEQPEPKISDYRSLERYWSDMRKLSGYAEPSQNTDRPQWYLDVERDQHTHAKQYRDIYLSDTRDPDNLLIDVDYQIAYYEGVIAAQADRINVNDPNSGKRLNARNRGDRGTIRTAVYKANLLWEGVRLATGTPGEDAVVKDCNYLDECEDRLDRLKLARRELLGDGQDGTFMLAGHPVESLSLRWKKREAARKVVTDQAVEEWITYNEGRMKTLLPQVQEGYRSAASIGAEFDYRATRMPIDASTLYADDTQLWNNADVQAAQRHLLEGKDALDGDKLAKELSQGVPYENYAKHRASYETALATYLADPVSRYNYGAVIESKLNLLNAESALLYQANVIASEREKSREAEPDRISRNPVNQEGAILQGLGMKIASAGNEIFSMMTPAFPRGHALQPAMG